MTWTYGGDPSSSLLDAVRFEIGDTDEADELLQDEEILYAIDQENDKVFLAAARCCEAIASKFMRESDQKVGPIDQKLTQRIVWYLRRAAALRGRFIQAIPSSYYAAPYFDKDMNTR